VFRSHAGQVLRDPIAWVFRTAYRLASDELRREAVTIGEAEGEQSSATAQSALPADLTEALGYLPPEQRLAVFLHYYADLPVREVARLSGASVATVKVRLHRARKALALRLQPLEVRDV
jgi:RNA polymerase sigma-70 factor (ECF subfamily)